MTREYDVERLKVKESILCILVVLAERGKSILEQMNNKADNTVEIYITLALNNVNFSFFPNDKKTSFTYDKVPRDTSK